jgi:hypothetical protein
MVKTTNDAFKRSIFIDPSNQSILTAIKTHISCNIMIIQTKTAFGTNRKKGRFYALPLSMQPAAKVGKEPILLALSC